MPMIYLLIREKKTKREKEGREPFPPCRLTGGVGGGGANFINNK
jgi:hypothetical protein